MYWPNLYEDRPKAISWLYLFDRNVGDMANEIWVQGMEHGWIARAHRVDIAAEKRHPRRRRFILSDWLSSAVQARGGRVTRESERAYSDLRAVRDARESGR